MSACIIKTMVLLMIIYLSACLSVLSLGSMCAYVRLRRATCVILHMHTIYFLYGHNDKVGIQFLNTGKYYTGVFGIVRSGILSFITYRISRDIHLDDNDL